MWKYVLLSSHFIKPLSDYAHIKRTENIIAIGNPVTIPVYFEEWELKQKKKQLLYVGRMDYENKRVNRIVEAWKVLYENMLIGNLFWWEKALIKVHWKNILEDMIFNVFVSKAFKYLLPYNIIRKLLYFIDFWFRRVWISSYWKYELWSGPSCVWKLWSYIWHHRQWKVWLNNSDTL